MKVGQTVDFQVNVSFIRAAKISKIHESGKVDLMVFTHPDDYPEFSQAECASGNGIRREIGEGTGPNTFQVRAVESNPADIEKITALEIKITNLEGTNSELNTKVTAIETTNMALENKVLILENQVAQLQPIVP